MLTILTSHPGCLLMEQFWGLPLEILIYNTSGVGWKSLSKSCRGDSHAGEPPTPGEALALVQSNGGGGGSATQWLQFLPWPPTDISCLQKVFCCHGVGWGWGIGESKGTNCGRKSPIHYPLLLVRTKVSTKPNSSVLRPLPCPLK